MHTKGPWEANGGIVEAFVDPENSSTYIAEICRMDDGWDMDTQDSNARLIAAAPELLEALKNCERWFNDHRALLGNPDVLDKARSAIQKAEGKP